MYPQTHACQVVEPGFQPIGIVACTLPTPEHRVSVHEVLSVSNEYKEAVSSIS